MKNSMILLTILLVVSCSKDEDLSHPPIPDKPSAMNVFCQKTPNDISQRVEYKYKNQNLITETVFFNEGMQDITSFEYNADNQLMLEVYKAHLYKAEKSYIYNDLKQLINIKYKFTNYDINGQISDETESEAPREYENNQLVKEWQYWGGFNTYEYNDGKVVTKIDYTRDGGKHHTTTYKYSGDLLIEEKKKETKEGNLMYLRIYTYDSLSRLVKIQDGENIIEEYKYIDNKLIEKRACYFGIDPGFYPCLGNYIYKYEY